MKIETKTIEAVVPGDFLVDLDNGYVFEVNEDAGDELTSSRYPTAFGRGLTMIGMHDRDGDEFYLLAPPTMEVRVGRL